MFVFICSIENVNAISCFKIIMLGCAITMAEPVTRCRPMYAVCRCGHQKSSAVDIDQITSCRQGENVVHSFECSQTDFLV